MHVCVCVRVCVRACVCACMHVCTSFTVLFFLIGITVNSPAGEITCKARLLMCLVDLPARASVLNMKQFNGKFGCSQCEDEGHPEPILTLYITGYIHHHLYFVHTNKSLPMLRKR